MRPNHSKNTKDPKRIRKHLKGSKIIQEIQKIPQDFKKHPKNSKSFRKIP